jgi:hypothetical protein
MTSDSNAQKPEWFEMAEGDVQTSPIPKTKKKVTIIAVLITSAIMGVGALVANGSESDANAEQGVTQTGTTNSTPTLPGKGTPSGIANPAQGGIQPPTGRGHDDGDGFPGAHKGEHRDGDHFDDHDGGAGHNEIG